MIPCTMKGPADLRPVWRGGVMQIHVTRACDQACFGCTQGSNLGGKPVMMSVEQFEQACRSLEGYFGVVGVFGGNPAMHPDFDEMCALMRDYFPFEQRGLWCNNLRGKGAHARVTFNPRYSNLNVHLDQEAKAEFERDWPEVIGLNNLKGYDSDARHGSPWIAMQDLDQLMMRDGSIVPNTEDARWQLIGDCDVNQKWSSMLYVFRGELRATPCEIMGAMSMLHQDNPDWNGTGQPIPDYGVDPVPGWWCQSIHEGKFAEAVKAQCHACGMPLRNYGQLAINGDREQFSKTHEYLAKPKCKGRPVEIVQLQSQIDQHPAELATDYMEKGT